MNSDQQVNRLNGAYRELSFQAILPVWMGSAQISVVFWIHQLVEPLHIICVFVKPQEIP